MLQFIAFKQSLHAVDHDCWGYGHRSKESTSAHSKSFKCSSCNFFYILGTSMQMVTFEEDVWCGFLSPRVPLHKGEGLLEPAGPGVFGVHQQHVRLRGQDDDSHGATVLLDARAQLKHHQGLSDDECELSSLLVYPPCLTVAVVGAGWLNLPLTAGVLTRGETIGQKHEVCIYKSTRHSLFMLCLPPVPRMPTTTSTQTASWWTQLSWPSAPLWPPTAAR